jgi:hypothetical protein
VGLPLPDTTLLVLGCFAALLVGLSKGGLPTVGMLAVPVMALKISPVTAAVLLLPIFVMTDMVGVYLYRRDFSLRNVKILIPAGMAGVLFGWAVASHLSDKGVALLIGLLGVGFCLNIWLRPTPAGEGKPGSVGWGWFWGSLAGFTSFVSHAVPDLRAAPAPEEDHLCRHLDHCVCRDQPVQGCALYAAASLFDDRPANGRVAGAHRLAGHRAGGLVDPAHARHLVLPPGAGGAVQRFHQTDL